MNVADRGVNFRPAAGGAVVEGTELTTEGGVVLGATEGAEVPVTTEGADDGTPATRRRGPFDPEADSTENSTTATSTATAIPATVIATRAGVETRDHRAPTGTGRRASASVASERTRRAARRATSSKRSGIVAVLEFEPRRQQAPGLVQCRFDRAVRATHHAADLFDGEIIDVAETDHLRLARRQTADGTPEIVVRRRRGARCRTGGEAAQGARFVSQPAPARGRSGHHHTPQPRRRVVVGHQPVPAAEGLEQRLLDEILGREPIGTQRVREREQRWSLMAREGLELGHPCRRNVAPPHSERASQHGVQCHTKYHARPGAGV